VEIAALIDTARTLGAGAIAQVDLGLRSHRHQSLRDLGGMATQVIAATWARATDQLPPDEVMLRQRPVPLTERPPARLVP
jgi:glucosyl-3-phosphoglycerate synthase